jgi:hypothetical protein
LATWNGNRPLQRPKYQPGWLFLQSMSGTNGEKPSNGWLGHEKWDSKDDSEYYFTPAIPGVIMTLILESQLLAVGNPVR